MILCIIKIPIRSFDGQSHGEAPLPLISRLKLFYEEAYKAAYDRLAEKYPGQSLSSLAPVPEDELLCEIKNELEIRGYDKQTIKTVKCNDLDQDTGFVKFFV